MLFNWTPHIGAAPDAGTALNFFYNFTMATAQGNNGGLYSAAARDAFIVSDLHDKGQSTRTSCNAFCHAEVRSVQPLYREVLLSWIIYQNGWSMIMCVLIDHSQF